MPKFMVQGSLSAAGVAGVMEEGGSRRHLVVKQACPKLGIGELARLERYVTAYDGGQFAFARTAAL